MTAVDTLFAGLCDDAAIFPPGNLPLQEAVPAHLRHRAAIHGSVVGPLVVAQADLPELTSLTGGLVERSLELAVTSPLSAVDGVPARVDQIPATWLTSVEVSLPTDASTADLMPALEEFRRAHPDLVVWVEVPRDHRRDPVLQLLPGIGCLAKFRTGGVRPDLYPDETELASSVKAAVGAGVPFKATAGLHHAVRNTDPDTGFEQHGFLNLLVATSAATSGADRDTVATLLADRDGNRIAERVRGIPTSAREWFRSFGTCSITDPLTELAQLDLLSPDLTKDLP